MNSSRRFFLKATSGAAFGLYLSPLGCESNSITPKFSGGQFDFLTPVDPSVDRGNRLDPSHFVQFGAQSSVMGWSYEGVEQVARADWQLELTGEFDTPTTLTFADIQAEIDASGDYTVLNTLRCIVDSTGIPGLVGTALWRGVPLSRFLQQAGVGADVRRFRIFARDGFTNNLRREDVLLTGDEPDREPLLAFQMNGDDVPHIHGGPVRLLVPRRYGYKSVKWAERIEATEDDTVFGSYQEVVGFFDDGTIQLTTKVTDPLARANVPAGMVELFGYALSGAEPIQAVEVSVDDGPFEPATLDTLEDIQAQAPAIADAIQIQRGATYPFPGVWTLFRFDWDAEPGPHRLRFRAIDAQGQVQIEDDQDGVDGLSGYWDIQVTVDG